jgi:serine/threonine protein kinase
MASQIGFENIPQVVGNYRVDGLLGNGAYGIVVSAAHMGTGAEVAIKMVSRQLLEEDSVLGAFEQELRIHESLNHENIIKVLGIIYEKDYIYIVMELCKNGDLLDYIQKNPNRTQRKILSYFFQILKAVAYLHERGIAHLDIKPENVLLYDDQTVKLGDFGCCEAPPKYDHGFARGTLFYAAPEILMTPSMDNRPADVWSLGILLFSLSAGVLPFQPGDDDFISQQIIRGQLIYPASMPSDIVALVSECCKLDPLERPSVASLLEQRLFQQEMASIVSHGRAGSFRGRPPPSISPTGSSSGFGSAGFLRRVVIVKPSISSKQLARIPTVGLPSAQAQIGGCKSFVFPSRSYVKMDSFEGPRHAGDI